MEQERTYKDRCFKYRDFLKSKFAIPHTNIVSSIDGSSFDPARLLGLILHYKQECTSLLSNLSRSHLTSEQFEHIMQLVNRVGDFEAQASSSSGAHVNLLGMAGSTNLFQNDDLWILDTLTMNRKMFNRRLKCLMVYIHLYVQLGVPYLF